MASINRRNAIALAGSTALAMSAPSLLQAAQPVRLGATPTAVLVWLADGMGLFRKSPHNIEIVKYTSGTKTAKDLVADKLDLATSSEFAFVSVTFDRPDLRILASLSRSRTIDVFARSDRGIRGYGDLTGKTVGVVQNSFAHFVLHRAVLESGARLGAMKPLAPLEIVSEIANGSIDAGVVWDPYLRQAAETLGEQFVPLPHQDWHDYEFVLHGASGWIGANQQASTEIVAMLVKAAQFAEADPASAKAIVGTRLDLDAATMEYLWPKHTLKLTLSQALLRLMEDEAWFRVDLGLSSGQVPNYLDFIAPDALLQADSAAVSMIGL